MTGEVAHLLARFPKFEMVVRRYVKIYEVKDFIRRDAFKSDNEKRSSSSRAGKGAGTG